MAKKRTEAEVTFIANDDGLKSTLKEISAELTKNRAELKLEQLNYNRLVLNQTS